MAARWINLPSKKAILPCSITTRALSGLATDNTSWGISNVWAYAQQYALADNFYMSAMNSEPAQELYMVAATVDSNHNASALPFYDPCSAVEQQAQGGGTISVPHDRDQRRRSADGEADTMDVLSDQLCQFAERDLHGLRATGRSVSVLHQYRKLFEYPKLHHVGLSVRAEQRNPSRRGLDSRRMEPTTCIRAVAIFWMESNG